MLAAGLRSEVRVSLQVRALEGELEDEIRSRAEAQRGARRLERCLKELTYQVLRETAPCWCAGAGYASSLKRPPRSAVLSLVPEARSAVDADWQARRSCAMSALGRSLFRALRKQNVSTSCN